MRRSWICILLLAFAVALVSSDVASAKKSRSKGASSQGRGKTSRASKGREVSRRDKTGRRRVAVGKKRDRRLARSRSRSRKYESQPIAAPVVQRSSPGIPAERVIEIQHALIKAGYMDGPASGLYDDATIDAMKEFQAKNGLSQTGLPSAMLLKKLGVPKGSNDGYAVPVKKVSENEKKRSANEPEF